MTTMNTNATSVSANFRSLAQSIMNKTAEAYASGKMTAGECVENCDQDIDILKGSFFQSVDTVCRLAGVTTLRLNIARVFECGCNERTGKKELYSMAKEIRAIVDEEIQELKECWDEDGAEILRKAFHEDSLVETFFKSMTWLCGKLWKKLRRLANFIGIHVDEKSILGTVFKGVGALAHLVNAGARVVVNIAKYAVSIVGAGALLIADYIWMGICWLFSKAKGLWEKAKNTLLTHDDEELFEEETDDQE